MLVAQDYVMRKKGVGGGVEAADHQPLGLKGQIGVLCEALQVHATVGGRHEPSDPLGGGGGLHCGGRVRPLAS